MSAKDSPATRLKRNRESGVNDDAEISLFSQGKTMFNQHKGQLAIGVAATLGAIVFYNWLERQQAKSDPAGHARLKRLKSVVRSGNLDPVEDKTDISRESNFSHASRENDHEGSAHR